ncbi:hypothetical protein EVAR_96706_1 [Eumeta japonica]|uniref:Uncharacterized protein n=1 Tax=Eumeta variegata TaxID=151549 RepID=A0A4C1WJG0_EUMVA|nr:hypothetical protein EVAR_96706_1 [Eumeta japonica]
MQFGARPTHDAARTGSEYRTDVVLSLLGQQQQFHFAFGQRPFPFPPDPLGGFRMPPITTCQNMSQFGLSSSNSHWGYGGAGYTPYLPSCAAPAAQFNGPALGFAGAVAEQPSAAQDYGNNTGCSRNAGAHLRCATIAEELKQTETAFTAHAPAEVRRARERRAAADRRT